MSESPMSVTENDCDEMPSTLGENMARLNGNNGNATGSRFIQHTDNGAIRKALKRKLSTGPTSNVTDSSYNSDTDSDSSSDLDTDNEREMTVNGKPLPKHDEQSSDPRNSNGSEQGSATLRPYRENAEERRNEYIYGQLSEQLSMEEISLAEINRKILSVSWKPSSSSR